MPGAIDGIALARIASQRWPKVGILVLSGHALTSELPAGALFLAKPVHSPLLLGALQHMAGG
jgi:hypothetical protein